MYPAVPLVCWVQSQPADRFTLALLLTARLALTMSTFTADELRRYDRHLSLPEFGSAGQERLRAARILIVGAGGLGSPAALYLAAAGAGTIGLVDFDEVDESNLQRQILYGTADVGRPKLDAAAARLRALNPHLVVSRHDDAVQRRRTARRSSRRTTSSSTAPTTFRRATS